MNFIADIHQKRIKEILLTKKYVIGGIICVLLIGGVSFGKVSGVSKENENTDIQTPQKTAYNFIYPEKIHDEEIQLIGRVLSHETASVFPRRSGIVGDILADIGDSVKKGDVLAYLLPEGVENESSLEVETQRNAMQKAKDEYENTQLLEQAGIDRMEQKVEEKFVNLRTIKNDNYSSQDNGLRMENEEINLAEAKLSVLETQLNKAENNRDAKLQESKNSIENAQDTVYVALQHTYQTALDVMGGGSGRFDEGSNRVISENDLNPSLGILDVNVRNEVVANFNNYRKALYVYGITTDEDYFTAIEGGKELLMTLQRLIDASSSSGKLSSSMINDLSNKIHLSQDKIDSASEKLQKAKDSYTVIQADVVDAVSILKRQWEEQKQNIALLQSKWQKSKSQVESQISLTESGIEQMQKELEYTRAMAQKNIDAAKNQYNIANTAYLKVAAQKGHTALISPFSGIVSKRSIEVGQNIMMSQSAFELVDVDTSLSQKAKNEIQFGLPEDLQTILSLDDEITFFLPEQETKLYRARVTRISPQVDSELHTFTVQAKLLDDISLPHHTSVQVKISTGEKKSYRVDSSVLKRENNQNYVWILKTDEPERLYVDVIEEDGEFAEITGDINEQTKIVLNYYGK
ncbi:MAG: hypothetical protein COV59_02510 [Candidatus Magasanikbacteria bacterium CG11_big_fil_rev_8_21_14_0_20_39_34]|uniref:Membrane fusion protein biotin-lipoyl like domain-containing protein n=1 Tax=Candidatus Magasanikbacteria bacterium CG11_big_fil_rev_8_21_14_0_20_39_34 TaxID=1974653 RepID=A0A2H0N558_9BACT|nr:MAG: hypothetical protein COV59_02510 [Candidatus Magasanikbacteria bacterium CG11_big_fil_rev_8_21_14_0_20_39_34]